MATQRRRVAVATTNRSDYWHLYWVLKELGRRRSVDLQLIIGGGHFSKLHGYTVTTIRKDGFVPAATIRAVPANDSETAVAVAVAETTRGAAAAFRRLKPDLVLVLGDRIELLGIAAAATAFRLPIAHIHGGESTYGLVDDAVRHAVSRLSHVHLVAAAAYGKRLQRMGEDRKRIHVVGAPGLDHLVRTKLPPVSAVLDQVGLGSHDPEGRPLFVVGFHPVTLEPGRGRKHARELARAIAKFDARVVWTAPNQDQESQQIFREMSRLEHPRLDVHFAATLGTPAYWSLLTKADVLIGNSSSGIVEAPSLGVPVVNVGSRQDGRLRARNIIDVEIEHRAIAEAIARAMKPSFRRRARAARNPYGGPGASRRIARILATMDLSPDILRKRWV